MSTQKTQGLTLAELKQGDIVWSLFFKRLLEFQEEMEFQGFLFKNVGIDGYTMLVEDDIEPISELMKELL